MKTAKLIFGGHEVGTSKIEEGDAQDLARRLWEHGKTVPPGKEITLEMSTRRVKFTRHSTRDEFVRAAAKAILEIENGPMIRKVSSSVPRRFDIPERMREFYPRMPRATLTIIRYT